MFGIVITAYNREQALLDLLNSLNKVINYSGLSIPLVISIDNNGTPEVIRVANSFEWKHGSKEVIIHREKLGLVKHFIWAGDQTERFNHVIFLEDDLLVSPELFYYTTQLIDFYEEDDKVAGASLYNPTINEFTGTKFYKIQDGYDNFFLQQPYWGNIWFKNKWAHFKKYLSNYQLNAECIPQRVANWKESFKKIYIQFLVDTNRYIATARISLATNNGCLGLHNVEALYMFQVNLQIGHKDYCFSHVEESLAVYDAFEELIPASFMRMNSALTNYDFEVDLNGLKTKYQKEYVLTTKRTSAAVFHFTSAMKPVELGVFYGIEGDRRVSLSKPSQIIETREYYSLRQWNDINKNYHLSYNFLVLMKIMKRSIEGIGNIFKYRVFKKH